MRTPERFLDEARSRITRFIDGAVEEAGAEGCVVAMSGGVDSSLVAALAAEADAGKSVGLGLPQAGVTSEADARDAEELASELGLGWRSVDVGPAVTELEDIGREVTDPSRDSRVNIAPRVRMTVTYLVANEEDLLVLGTGNRSELLLGYFTKHGDGAADILPIGDLYKTQVFELAGSVGLPGRIIEKEPSAALYPGQTDESELGLPYSDLDGVLRLLVDEGFTSTEAAEETGLEVKRVRAVEERVVSNEHKRAFPQTPGLQGREKG